MRFIAVDFRRRGTHAAMPSLIAHEGQPHRATVGRQWAVERTCHVVGGSTRQFSDFRLICTNDGISTACRVRSFRQRQSRATCGCGHSCEARYEGGGGHVTRAAAGGLGVRVGGDYNHRCFGVCASRSCLPLEVAANSSAWLCSKSLKLRFRSHLASPLGSGEGETRTEKKFKPARHGSAGQAGCPLA